MKLIENFDKAVIVKDYVKSRKHEWHEACYIPDVKDQDNARRVIENFVKRQGDDIVGGIIRKLQVKNVILIQFAVFCIKM